LGGSVGREGSVGRRVGIVVGVCAVVGRFGVIGTRRRRRSVGVNDEAGDDDSGASPRYEPDGGIVLIAVNQEYSRRERGKSGRMGRPSSSSSAGRSPMLFIFVPFYRSSKCPDVSPWRPFARRAALILPFFLHLCCQTIRTKVSAPFLSKLTRPRLCPACSDTVFFGAWFRHAFPQRLYFG
jgi:hypothetical protein